MAKAKTTSSNKVNFGKRREGKAKKRRGPKDKPVKKYNRQGRQSSDEIGKHNSLRNYDRKVSGFDSQLDYKYKNMEKQIIENKAEKAPKVTKKQKEFVSEETIAMFEEILKDYAIDLKYRPFIKQLVNEYRKNG